MMFGLNMIHILIILVVISIIGLGYLEIRKIKMELESHDKFLKKLLIPTIKQPINNQSYCQVQKNTNVFIYYKTLIMRAELKEEDIPMV